MMKARPTIHDDVFNQLGLDICSGHYPINAVLPIEPLLCTRFGVSRIVIREAVKSLVAKGMVCVRRRTGTVVQPTDNWQLFDPTVVAWRAHSGMVDEKFIVDLMELRRVVEPAAARLAAERAGAEDLAMMRSSLDAMANAIAGKGKYVPADLAFHGAVLDACHNQFLKQMQQAINVILEVSFSISSQVPQGPDSSQSLHENLYLGILSGDAQKAEKASLKIIERAEIDLRASIKNVKGKKQA